jgi:hypothetical protein
MPNLPDGRTNPSLIVVDSCLCVIGGQGLTQNILLLDLQTGTEWEELNGDLPMLGLMGCFRYRLSDQDPDVIVVFGGTDE